MVKQQDFQKIALQLNPCRSHKLIFQWLYLDFISMDQKHTIQILEALFISFKKYVFVLRLLFELEKKV